MRTSTAHRRRLPRLAAIGAGAALLASLAGPAATASAAGTGSTRASRLVASAFATSQAATSVTVNGTFLDGSKVITIHVTDAKGGSGFGTVKAQGQTFHIVQAGAANYFKAGTSYWAKILGSKTALAVPVYSGHWVKSSSTTPNSPGEVFSAFVDMTTFLGGFNTGGVHWVIAGRTTFRGQRVTTVRGTQHGMTGTLLIAAKGPPYLMAIEPPRGQGRITFANWDKPVNVRAPAQWVPFSPPSTSLSP